MIKKIDEYNIALTGMMATGKSVVGLKLSEELKKQFVDTDRMIEKKTGMSIPEIFESYGEAYFRHYEKKIITELSRHPQGSMVIALGGGALINADNRSYLQRSSILILLTADPKTILTRVLKEGGRPLLKDGNPEEKIRKLLEERKQIYNLYDIKIDTEDKDIEEIVKEIKIKLRQS